jgi:hypothetical protein
VNQEEAEKGKEKAEEREFESGREQQNAAGHDNDDRRRRRSGCGEWKR